MAHIRPTLRRVPAAVVVVAHGTSPPRIGLRLAMLTLAIALLPIALGDNPIGTRSRGGPTRHADVIGSGTGLSELTRIKLDGPVYDLAYDRARGSLWFAYMALSAPAGLYRYGLADGSLDRWSLPEADYNGFVSKIRVSPDGAVWLNELYSVIRLDPIEGSIDELKLAMTDPDAVSSALDPDSPSPGTWPASIAVEPDGTALVIRHNVSSVLHLTSQLAIAGRIPLPTGVVGPRDLLDLHGNVYLASPDEAAVMTEEGSLISSSAAGALRLASDGNRVLGIGSGSLVEMSAVEAPISRATGGSPNDLVAASPSDVFVWRRDLATIQKLSTAGELTVAMQFPTTLSDGPRPAGAAGTVLDSVEITAMTTDSAGSLWCVESVDGATYLVELAL